MVYLTINDLGAAFSGNADKAKMLMGNFGTMTMLRVSNEDTASDRKRIEDEKTIHEMFIDLVKNAVNFAKAILVCPECGHKLDYIHRSKKKNYIK